MTLRERKRLAEIVYSFIETRTRNNSPADADIVSNMASDCFSDIIKRFNIKDELFECVNDDPYTDEEDKEFLISYIK